MSTNPKGFKGEFLVALGLLCLVLLLPFYPSFQAGIAHFANDGPLGNIMAEAIRVPGGFTGQWNNLNWLGAFGGLIHVNISSVMRWWMGPVGFAKFLQPASCLFLGVCAWFFFRQLQLRQSTALLAAIAAMLNMNLFSNVCWGLGSRATTVGLALVAMGIIVSPRIKAMWQKTALAGFAIGMAVMEGADIGALMAIYFALFACFFWASEGGWNGGNYLKITGRMVVVVAFALFMAYQGVFTLADTAVKGVVGAKDGPRSAEEERTRWDWATQWSLPKAETFRVIIPGLFGYRLNSTADGNVGGDYWGAVGQQPGWMEHHQGFPRHSGSGEYAGILVVLVALWAAARGMARTQKVFSPGERRFILFWAGIAVVSLLFAWGRHAPFYQFLYQLPYFSNVRNPMKFMHPFHVALMVLFAYGVEGLTRQYLAPAGVAGSLVEQLQRWWSKLAGFDKKWVFGCLGALGVSVLGWLLYASSKPALLQYLGKAGFNPEQSQNIARFSYGEVGLYLFMLVIALLWLFAVMSGAFAGARAKWALLAAGIILTLDLTRANAHWVVYYNYAEKYASNPVVDAMRVKPHEQRVDILNLSGNPQYDMFRQFYFVEWAQHHFWYYGIQSIGIVQMPRVPEDYAAYMKAVSVNPARYWQLTNTRWFLGPANVSGLLSQSFGGASFNEVMRFNLVQDSKGMINAATNATGPFALYSFNNVLTRAALFADWEVSTNDTATLATLTNASFDPFKKVLVAESEAGAPTAENKSRPPGTAQIESYASKRIAIKVTAAVPAVLMLNEKYDPNWKVRIDGQPAALLRCNYIMRGVAVPAGEHKVEFSFEPETRPLYISLAAIAAAVLLAAFVMVTNRGEPAEPSTAPAEPVKDKNGKR